MIIVEKHPKYVWLHTDDKSMVITNWDKKDILTYSGSKHIYVHTDEEVEAYYEITEEEHFKLVAEREEAEMPEMNEEIEENKTEE